ncbi:unnamed protein product [Colias eurytheme]|nr:unnamed protein product [Colias eurytheme]
MSNLKDYLQLMTAAARPGKAAAVMFVVTIQTADLTKAQVLKPAAVVRRRAEHARAAIAISNRATHARGGGGDGAETPADIGRTSGGVDVRTSTGTALPCEVDGNEPSYCSATTGCVLGRCSLCPILFARDRLSTMVNNKSYATQGKLNVLSKV